MFRALYFKKETVAVVEMAFYIMNITLLTFLVGRKDVFKKENTGWQIKLDVTTGHVIFRACMNASFLI